MTWSQCKVFWKKDVMAAEIFYTPSYLPAHPLLIRKMSLLDPCFLSEAFSIINVRLSVMGGSFRLFRHVRTF